MCGVNEGVRQRWAGWRGGDGGRRIERWNTRWLSAATLSVSRAQYTLTCILTEYHDDRVSRMVGLGVEARGLKMCLTAVTKFAKKWVHFSNVHTGCSGKFHRLANGWTSSKNRDVMSRIWVVCFSGGGRKCGFLLHANDGGILKSPLNVLVALEETSKFCQRSAPSWGTY